MSILSKNQILSRLLDADFEKRLVVSPILDRGVQIGEGTVDLRLGTDFIIPKRNHAHIFDPMDTQAMEEVHLRSDKEHVDIGRPFHLHPNKVVLAGTLEYLRMPTDLTGRVRTRSSYERLGLHISTLTSPGYKGSLTIALVNTGNTPIVLYPGIRIVQMTVYTLSDSAQVDGYSGKYNHEVGPIFSKAHLDKDLDTLRNIKDD